MTKYWCQLAWLGGEYVVPGVLIRTLDGAITEVTPEVIMPPPDAVTLAGLTLPGFVNGHSHVFHRALRARTHAESEDFWSWRDAMYDLADSLDPDMLYRLARATFGEMLLAGITTVGEFHYLHHQPGGVPYSDPNAMSEAMIVAAADAGIRLTLLDTLYLRGGLDEDLSPTQLRFSDGTPEAWVERVEGLRATPRLRVGAAIHSIRAVERDDMAQLVDWAHANDAVVHAHVSEQPAENAVSIREYGHSPVHVFAEAGALDERFTAVHATHLDDADIELLANAGATCCICPTTERELADGIADSGRMATAEIPMSLGTDAHAVIDMHEEMRAVELNQRLSTGRRGTHDPLELLNMATVAGARSVGWPELGRIAVGAPADMTTVALNGVRMAGTDHSNALDAAVFAAAAADVTTVIVGADIIVDQGLHTAIDVAAELEAALSEL